MRSPSAKDKQYQDDEAAAREMCNNPPFLQDFPPEVQDLVVSKLSLYHVRLGTRAFNLIAPVMLIHLMEHSTLDSIPEISRHAG